MLDFNVATGDLEAASCLNSLQSSVENEKPSVITLQSDFSTGDDSYRFEISSDGTGKIIYSDCVSDTEEFEHEADVVALTAEIKGLINAEVESQNKQSQLEQSDIEVIREEITQQKLVEVFWDSINDKLEDPFFGSAYDDVWGEELRCERGSVEELTEFLELCLLTEHEIKDTDCYLIIEAETDYEAAGISTIGYWSERISQLAEIACEYFKPSGYRYDYNDGAYDRYSGYSMERESICIELAKAVGVSTREKMLGMKRLEKKLDEIGIAGETTRKLTNF